MKRLYVAVLAAALTGGGVLSAIQDPAPKPQTPTFRSSVQVIEVDVRVFDKDGRFVTGLTRDDFEVVEEGKPQQVDAMYFVSPGGTTNAVTADPATAPTAAAPLAAPVAPQTWIFFFDLNHLTPGGGFDRARKAVEDFIRDKFKDGDLAGILAGDKMVGNRLTSVRAELLEAVKQVKPLADSRNRQLQLTREWPRLLNEDEALRIARNEREAIQPAVTRACADDPDMCLIADTSVMEKGRQMAVLIHRASQLTMSALNALASGLARVPGPKTVVFLSDGFVVQDIETSLRSVVGQTGRAGARVYAIDVRGLNRNAPGDSLQQAQAENASGPITKFDSFADGPNSLAVDTGGIMIRNENNIGRALTQIGEDAGRYYVLAYRPANTTFDGKFRAIQVRVKRDGARVRARRGYLALDPARMTVPQPIKGPTDVTPEPANPSVATPDLKVGPTTPVPPMSDLKVVSPVATPPDLKVGPTGPVAGAGAGAGREIATRLRPDSEGRVKALSSREAVPAADAAKIGWDAYQRGDVEAALFAFSAAASQPGVRPWVLYALGMSQAALGRSSEAVVSWERVRQAAPDFEPVYMDLADTYTQKSDLTLALAVLRDAETRWPGSAEIQSAIGVIHVRRGALDDGITALTKAAALAPGDALMHLNLGRAYQLRFVRGRRYVTSQRRWVAPDGDRQKAAGAFERCIELGGPYAQQAREALSLLEWSKAG